MWREGCLRPCGLLQLEHRTRIAWMDRVTIAAASCEVPDRTVEKLCIPRFSPQDAQVNCKSLNVPPTIDLPPCNCGIARSLAAHDLINLEYSMSQDFLPLTTDLAAISDEEVLRNWAGCGPLFPSLLTASGKSLSNVWFLSVPWHRP